jgi:NADH dehydrogenase
MLSMKKKVIIIGAGFAGVQLAKNLDSNLFDIMLIDKINHHQFQPLFYQVATSQIEPSSISFPIRYIFYKKRNIEIRLANVNFINYESKLIHTNIGNFEYDTLVIAIGCKTNFFGNKEIEANVFTLKSTYDAIEIRNHILKTFEAIISTDGSEKEYLQNLVIVGAGATGVELAGAFTEIRKYNLPKDYPNIDFTQYKIILIEGSKNTLNNMSENSKRLSEKYLIEMGVILYKETFVKNYNGLDLELSSGEIIKTKSVIWAAGVIGNIIDCKVKFINKLGILGNNGPITIIVSKQFHNDNDNINEIKQGDIIKVEVIAKKLAAGTYLIMITDNKGNKINSGKLVKQ